MGWNWGGAGQGAVSGASTGSAFGPWGAAIGGGVGGLLGGFMGGDEEDPRRDAAKYLTQIPGVGREFYNPFINRGNRANNLLEGEYGKLLHPTSFIDDIMKHYNLSEGARYEQDKLGKGIGATAAAGGFAGTPEHQRYYGEMAHKIMSGDMQQYLQNALGVYGAGLSGNQGFADRGYDASSALADLIGGTLASQAGLEFQGANQHNADRQARMNALSKAFSTGVGAWNSWNKQQNETA